MFDDGTNSFTWIATNDVGGTMESAWDMVRARKQEQQTKVIDVFFLF